MQNYVIQLQVSYSDEQKTFYGHFKEKNGLVLWQGRLVYLTALFRCHVFSTAVLFVFGNPLFNFYLF